ADARGVLVIVPVYSIRASLRDSRDARALEVTELGLLRYIEVIVGAAARCPHSVENVTILHVCARADAGRARRQPIIGVIEALVMAELVRSRVGEGVVQTHA